MYRLRATGFQREGERRDDTNWDHLCEWMGLGKQWTGFTTGRGQGLNSSRVATDLDSWARGQEGIANGWEAHTASLSLRLPEAKMRRLLLPRWNENILVYKLSLYN